MKKQSPDIDALKPLASVVQLLGVRLIDFTGRTAVADAAQAGEVSIETAWTSRALIGNQGRFNVLAELTTDLKPKSSKKAPVVVVKATFELAYVLPPERTFDDEALQAFARLNGVFNVWPYWREFVQMSLVRMGLPPITLPVYRVGMARKGSIVPASSQGRTARSKAGLAPARRRER